MNSEEQYERAKAAAVRTQTFFVAVGSSWRSGRICTRKGKKVECGHKHKKPEAARRCVKKMSKDRLPKCCGYSVAKYEAFFIPKAKDSRP